MMRSPPLPVASSVFSVRWSVFSEQRLMIGH